MLQSGVPLACPLRCVAPERIVANKAVRRLVDTLSPPPPPEQPARQALLAMCTAPRRTCYRHRIFASVMGFRDQMSVLFLIQWLLL